MYNLELEKGSFFTVTDNEEGTQKIILSHDTAENYFPDGDAVGKQVILVASKTTFKQNKTNITTKNTLHANCPKSTGSHFLIK